MYARLISHPVSTAILGAVLGAVLGSVATKHQYAQQEENASTREACLILPDLENVVRGVELARSGTIQDISELPPTPVLGVASLEVPNLPAELKREVLYVNSSWQSLTVHMVKVAHTDDQQDRQDEVDKLEAAGNATLALVDEVQPKLEELCKS